MNLVQQLKMDMQNGQEPEFSVAAVVAAWQLQRQDLLNHYLQAPGAVSELGAQLAMLQIEPGLVVALLNRWGLSHEFGQAVQRESLSSAQVWEKIVELAQIPRQLRGTYNPATNKLKIPENIEAFLINDEDPLLMLVRELNWAVDLPVELNLVSGTLRSYAATVEVAEFLKQPAEQFAQQQLKTQLSVHSSQGLSGSGLAILAAVLVSLSACGPVPTKPPGTPTGSPPSNSSPDCVVRRAQFYDNLYQLRSGMTEEEVDRIVDPRREYRKRSYNYSISYEILGFDYSVPGVVTCEAVQIHYDANWRYRFFTTRTYPL